MSAVPRVPYAVYRSTSCETDRDPFGPPAVPEVLRRRWLTAWLTAWWRKPEPPQEGRPSGEGGA